MTRIPMIACAFFSVPQSILNHFRADSMDMKIKMRMAWIEGAVIAAMCPVAAEQMQIYRPSFGRNVRPMEKFSGRPSFGRMKTRNSNLNLANIELRNPHGGLLHLQFHVCFSMPIWIRSSQLSLRSFLDCVQARFGVFLHLANTDRTTFVAIADRDFRARNNCSARILDFPCHCT